MHPDHLEYARFTSRARFEKSVNSLLGLIEGIAIDSCINPSEISFLNLWLAEHADVRDRHPYNELVPVVQAAVADGVLTQEEHDDIVWLCERLRSTEYFDQTTADLQRLHAILGGIVSDGQVTEDELRGLSACLGSGGRWQTPNLGTPNLGSWGARHLTSARRSDGRRPWPPGCSIAP